MNEKLSTPSVCLIGIVYHIPRFSLPHDLNNLALIFYVPLVLLTRTIVDRLQVIPVLVSVPYLLGRTMHPHINGKAILAAEEMMS